MAINQFSIKEALLYGFRKTLEHIWLFLAIEGIIFLGWIFIAISEVILAVPPVNADAAILRDPNYLQKFINLIGIVLSDAIPLSIKPFIHFILSIVMFCLFLFSAAFLQGLRRVMLDIYDLNQSKPKQMFSQLNRIFAVLFAHAFYSFMVSFGFVLLLIPGIYFSAKYGFYGYCMLENEELGPIGALKQSARITKGSMMNLCIYSITWILLFYVGLFSLIGWVIIFPALMLSYVYIYRHLVASSLNANNQYR